MSLIKKNEEINKKLFIKIADEKNRGLNINGVKYSVFDWNGKLVSGDKLSAINDSDGFYYAPFSTDIKNGAYKIIWVIPGFESRESSFFIVDKNAYPCTRCSGGVKPEAIPPPGSKTFIVGHILSPDDLKIYFRDPTTNILTDPAVVYWSLYNSKGCLVKADTLGTKTSTGVYWVNWIIYGQSGDYELVWKYKSTNNSPWSQISEKISFICPKNSYPL